MAERGKYGEPWPDDHGYADTEREVVGMHILTIKEFSRARKCVSALDGVANPEQAVAALVEAAREARHLLLEVSWPHLAADLNAALAAFPGEKQG